MVMLLYDTIMFVPVEMTTMTTELDDYVTLAEAAALLRVHKSTVRRWIDQGEIEFIKAFAEPLPMMVIAELLGFPPMDLPQLKEWSYAWVLPFSRGLTLEQELWAVEKHIELQHYIYHMFEHLRSSNRALFRNMSNQQHGCSRLLGGVQQKLRTVCNLRHTTGRRCNRTGCDGLNRIYNNQVECTPAYCSSNVVGTGTSGQF